MTNRARPNWPAQSINARYPALSASKVAVPNKAPRSSRTAAAWKCLWVSTPMMTRPLGVSVGMIVIATFQQGCDADRSGGTRL